MILLIFPVIFLGSCENVFFPGIEGEGDVIDTEVYPSDFTGFANATNADIVLTRGSEQKVVIRAQQNIMENLKLDVRHGSWIIAPRKWVRRAEPVTVFITIPEIEEIILSGSGNITTTNFFEDSGDVSLIISGSGDIDFAGDMRDLNVLISGSGDIDLEGGAETMELVISGSGDVDSYPMDLEKARVTISGSGNVNVFAADYLNILISGSGDVYYKGSPELETHISGSGRVIDDN